MAASLLSRRVFLNKNNICKIPRRNGYIVLLPEIGDDLPEKNPLLKKNTKLPEFDKFTIEKCIAAIGRQAIETEQNVKNLEEKSQKIKSEEIFEKLIDPLEEISTSLETTWGIAKTLYLGNQTLMPTRVFENIQKRASRGRLSKFQSKDIYIACKKAYENDSLKLTQEERQVLFKFVTEGKLQGLDSQNKIDIGFYQTEVYKEQEMFNMKYEMAKKKLRRRIADPHIFKDFPENLLAIFASDSSQPHQGPWTVTYESKIVTKFLEYCPDAFLRFKVWQEKVKMCSMEDEKPHQTSVHVEGIRLYRNKYAKLLGYNSYADMSMETKMAENLDNIYNALQIIYDTAKPCQELEINQLTKFAYERSFEGSINEWDIPYWSRKQLRTNYKYDKDAFCEYFPLSHVLKELYHICENLFNIKVVEEKIPDVWHKDVRYFEVYDLSESSSEPVSSFYLDPYSRSEHKLMIPGAMSVIKQKSSVSGSKPLLALIFNFQPPTPERESLLTFKDVSDLFQKFGYALRTLLAKVKYHLTAEPIEWDAVGIPGYFLENRLYEKSTLRKISKHYETGEPLCDDIINNLTNIRSNMAGYNLCKEMYLSELDLELHMAKKEYWASVSSRLWNKYFVLPMHNDNDHVCSFVDIFIGQWGAAYYSSLWSKMCAADAYSAFHEIASNDEKHEQEIGKRFRETFLAYGGSYPMSEVFRQFRGRDPSPLAILKILNLKKPGAESVKAQIESLKPNLIE